MKKIVLWLMSTLTAVTLLFGYHTSTSSGAAASAGGNAGAEAPGTATGTGSGTSSSSSAASSSSASSTSTTVTGSVAQTRWGPVQVRLTVAGGKITAVDVVQYPDGNGKDQQINAQALPILVTETLRAQSAT